MTKLTREASGLAGVHRQFRASVLASVTALSLGCGIASAQEQGVAIELNKLESQGAGCRVYFVVANKAAGYKALKLDLVLFRRDGVIGRRFAVELGPLKSDKRSVKLFDINDTACDQIGSLLINDVMECKLELGTVDDCLKDIGVSTLTSVPLKK